MANKKENYIEITPDLFATIKEYCEYNNLSITPFVNDLLKRSFLIEKYGEAPSVLQKPKEKPQSTIMAPLSENEKADVENKEKIENSEILTTKPKVKKKVKTY